MSQPIITSALEIHPLECGNHVRIHFRDGSREDAIVPLAAVERALAELA